MHAQTSTPTPIGTAISSPLNTFAPVPVSIARVRRNHVQIAYDITTLARNNNVRAIAVSGHMAKFSDMANAYRAMASVPIVIASPLQRVNVRSFAKSDLGVARWTFIVNASAQLSTRLVTRALHT